MGKNRRYMDFLYTGRVKCPNCGVMAVAGAPDCAACGIIFAKYLAQREREKKEAAEFLALSQVPGASAPKLCTTP